MINIEEIHSKINDIRILVSQNKIEKAITKLIEYSNWINDKKLRNSILLTCARYNKNKEDSLLGVNDSLIDRNSSILSLLEFLDELENASIDKSNSQEKKLSLTIIQEVDIKKSYDLLLRDSLNFESLSQDKKEELYIRLLKVKKFMFEKIDDKFKHDYPNIIFNRIFFAKNLERDEIKEISTIPNDKSFTWVDKSIIVSALSLSLINNFNIEKVDLLLNFIHSFEDKVWHRALVGLVLGLHQRENKILLYPKLIKKLERLQEIEDVQKGIRIITSALNLENYKNCFRNSSDLLANQFKVLRKVEQWFLPFYDENPVLEKIKIDLPNIEKIERLPFLLTNDRHLCNSQKYAICLSLHSWEPSKIKELIKDLEGAEACTREHVYDSYIADFYFFFKEFPAFELTNIFQQKINIYNTSLVDILIKEDKRNLFQGLIAYESKDYRKAIEYFNESTNYNQDCQTYCLMGLSYYKTNNYKKAIEAQKSAYELDDKHFHSFEIIFKCHFRLNEYEEAVDNLIILKENEQDYEDLEEQLINLGIEKYKNGEIETATIIMENLFRLNPDNCGYNSNAGFGYLLLGNYEKSKELNENSLKLEDCYLAHKNLGHYYLIQKNKPKAIEHYKSSFKLVSDTDMLSDLIREDFSFIDSEKVELSTFLNLEIEEKIKTEANKG
ncbi:MAG: CDC27 family protein [Saprospiraceae bacterium]